MAAPFLYSSATRTPRIEPRNHAFAGATVEKLACSDKIRF